MAPTLHGILSNTGHEVMVHLSGGSKWDGGASSFGPVSFMQFLVQILPSNGLVPHTSLYKYIPPQYCFSLGEIKIWGEAQFNLHNFHLPGSSELLTFQIGSVQ